MITPYSSLPRVSNVILSTTRQVSSKYPRPFPRPFKRRLFEEGLKPILPQKIESCVGPSVIHQNKLEESKQYMDVELALADLVKKWVISEEYRVVAICQFLPVNGRTLWMAKNQLRTKGLEFRNYGNKVMKKVFEGTPLSSLDNVLVGSNAFLFGKDPKSVKAIVNETDKLNWIVPLAIVVNNQILSMDYAKKLAEYRDLEDIRAETVQILTSQLGQIPMTMDSLGNQLVGSLSYLSNKNDK